MNTVSLLLQDSGTVEYYTDPRIIEAARRVMGGIDLDPASSQLANRTVKAEMFFSLQDDADYTNPVTQLGYGRESESIVDESPLWP